MKVVFLEDVDGVAKGGEVKEVKNGFARNYLIPKKLAAPATHNHLQRISKLSKLADEDRVKKAEWLVMMGICSHLGCVPLADKGEYNGWFCPCHGSHYDTSGRIRKGPAPTNMEIPKYAFVDENTIKIG